MGDGKEKTHEQSWQLSPRLKEVMKQSRPQSQKRTPGSGEKQDKTPCENTSRVNEEQAHLKIADWGGSAGKWPKMGQIITNLLGN